MQEVTPRMMTKTGGWGVKGGVLVATVLLAAATVGAAVAPARRAGQTQAEWDNTFLAAWKQQNRVDLGVPSDGAKVVIVKFNDWMCPACKASFEALAPIITKYEAAPGALKYVELDWPWNSDCNVMVRQTIPGHEAACDAAAAVRIAADKGKRDDMVAWLFANQEGMTPSQVVEETRQMLGVTDFPADYGAKLPDIRHDVDAGRAVNVQSTPTYFINGIRAAGPGGQIIQPHDFELAIEYELKK